jgi:Matrixin/PEP-CTERM motif
MRNHHRIAAVAFGLILGGFVRPLAADPIPLNAAVTTAPGQPVVITYSYSNLLDGTFLLMSPSLIRAATEEALRLWAAFAPLHFVEQVDSGPPPSDLSYKADGTPDIRIGHHATGDHAHAFFPNPGDGLGGDIHLDSGGAWSVAGGPWNFLEAITHELGHSIGLTHEFDRLAIMNPFYPQQRFTGLGTTFLYPADIEQLRSIYGSGAGSVTPLAPTPEPGTLLLAASGIALLAYRRRRSATTSG